MGFLSREPSVSAFKLVSDTCIEVNLGIPPKFPGGATKIQSNLMLGIGWVTLEHRDGALYVDNVQIDPKNGLILHPNFMEPLLLYQATMIPESWKDIGMRVYCKGVVFGYSDTDRTCTRYITWCQSQWFAGEEISAVQQ